STLYTSDMLVYKVLNGHHAGPEFNFGFIRVVSPSGSMGYHEVYASSYRVVFLKLSDRGYEPASPFYPSVPAVPGVQVQKGTVLDNVIARVAAVLESGNLTTSDRMEAI